MQNTKMAKVIRTCLNIWVNAKGRYGMHWEPRAAREFNLASKFLRDWVTNGGGTLPTQAIKSQGTSDLTKIAASLETLQQGTTPKELPFPSFDCNNDRDRRVWSPRWPTEWHAYVRRTDNYAIALTLITRSGWFQRNSEIISSTKNTAWK